MQDWLTKVIWVWGERLRVELPLPSGKLGLASNLFCTLILLDKTNLYHCSLITSAFEEYVFSTTKASDNIFYMLAENMLKFESQQKRKCQHKPL